MLASSLTFSDADWVGLSPTTFEELCGDLLVALGFDSVTLYGGPGDKGRDLLCTRAFDFGPGFSTTCNFVIQCKHTPTRLPRRDIVDDLAKAIEHSCDFWWLLTSAHLTPGDRDWFASLPRSRYGFSIHTLDRTMLQRWLTQHPVVLTKFFPNIADRILACHAAAMALMAAHNYDDAIEVLTSEGGAHPRTAYLLACCTSMLAQHRPSECDALCGASIAHLRNAQQGGLLGYLHTAFGWPQAKSNYEIHRDPELARVRQHSPSAFAAVFAPPPQSGGGGCFPEATPILMHDGSSRPIKDVCAGDFVRSVSASTWTPDACARVLDMRTTTATSLIMLNESVSISPTQLVMTVCGWRQAAALGIGDLILSRHGAVPVQTLARVDQHTTVCHLVLDKPHVYFASGISVHNKLCIA